MRNRTLNITVALVQILVVLSLQTWCYVPSAARWVDSRKVACCQHDHRLCGCDPARVAAHTCCCCQSARLKVAINLTGRTTSKIKSCCGHTAPPKRYLSAVPCGSHPDYIITALDTSPFTRHETVQIAPRTVCGIIVPESPTSLTSRTIDPPVPPPKPAVLS